MNHEIKDELLKLFKGDEIFINADIAKGIHQYAVKFKKITINFKVKNDEKQSELNEKLNNFKLKMTMVDIMYYQCVRIACQLMATLPSSIR